MAGLALGVASLGWCMENALPLHGYGQIVGAIIASCLLGLLVVRFICHFDTLWADLKHPVVGSIVPTFAMALMVISKAIGGSQPMSVVVYDRDLDKWGPGAHAGTFRGNQLAMAAGIVSMKRISDPAFLSEVTRKGNIMMDRILRLQKEVSIIGDVRGKGLMIGVEFIDPNGPKDLMGVPEPSGEVASLVQKGCFENRLIMERGGRNGSVMRCLCPLNVSDEDIDTAMTIFEKVVRETDEKYRN